jgi:hypothetical protein
MRFATKKALCILATLQTFALGRRMDKSMWHLPLYPPDRDKWDWFFTVPRRGFSDEEPVLLAQRGRTNGKRPPERLLTDQWEF